MTDEVMAEESLISYRKEPKWAGKMFMQDENTCYKDGFLAGLKASRPEWHKVADGDLPPEDEISGASINVLTDSGCIAYYIYGAHHWYNARGYSIGTPKAWCEIPEYTEE